MKHRLGTLSYCESFSQMEENLRGKVGFADNDFLVSQYNISTADLVMNSILPVYTSCLHSLVANNVLIASTSSTRKKGTVTPEALAKRWRIGLDLAKRTIERTTQLGVRDFTAIQGSRRLRHSNQQFKYRRFNATCYTDTMLPMVPTLQILALRFTRLPSSGPRYIRFDQEQMPLQHLICCIMNTVYFTP